MEKSSSQWMSIGQAAKYLGISRDTLRRWEKRGKIKAIRSPTNRRYYTKKLLDAAMSGKKLGQKKITSKPKSSKTPQLIIIAVISLAVAIALGLALQFFLLK